MANEETTGGSPDGGMPSALDALALIQQLLSGHTLATMKGLSARSLEAIYAAAYGLYNQSKYAQAEKLFRFLVLHDHLDRRFCKGLAACLQYQGRHEDAAKYYGAASMLDLTDPEPVVQAAQCLMGLSRLDEAEEALRFAEGQVEGEARHAALAQRVDALQEVIARLRERKAAPST